ncbi:MAG: protein kinase [Verrucomicrobiae bacterium]|nr:protein kinase [Verrucomicrobiae bacterium]
MSRHASYPPPPDIPDYTLLKPIGRGSYGEVWLARSVTGVFRVIKVVRRDRFEDARPFMRELEGISRFQATVSGRPRQLALLHVGRNEAAGYFYYVMEPADDAESGSEIDPDRYVPLTLKELFTRRGRLPATECVQLTLELARGLAVLHEANLSHRDIKPSNIIFVQRVPKLADVGLVADNEATMTCAGTPGYAPPEGAGSPAADIYSLGKVLYELATGLDRMEFPRLPSDLPDGPDVALLGEINALVLRACHPDPTRRQQSGQALARELEFIQAGRSVAFYEGLRKRVRAFALAAGTVTLLTSLVAALLVWRSGILERANDATRRALYRSDLAVAQLAMASGDLGRARAALQRQIPEPGQTDLRGLEWDILTREVRGEGTPLPSLTNGVAVRKIVVDPTGRRAAANFADNRVAVWDLETRQITHQFENVQVLGGFSPEGYLVVDEPTRALRFEDLDAPHPHTQRRVETGQRLVAYLNDGRIVVLSREGDLVLSALNILTGRVDGQFNINARYPDFVISAIDVSPDGRRIAVGLLKEAGAARKRILVSLDLEANVVLWDKVVDGRIIWVKAAPDAEHFSVNIGGLTPRIYSYSANRPNVPLVGHTSRVQDAAYSWMGDLFATAGADQAVRVWSVDSGELVSTHRGLGRPVISLDWLPDGKRLVAGDDLGNFHIFDIPSTEPPDIYSGAYADVHGDITFDPTGALIAVTESTNRVALISADDLTAKVPVDGMFQPITFSGDGELIFGFAMDWSVLSFSRISGEFTKLKVRPPEEFSVNSWTVSEAEGLVGLAGGDGRVCIIDLTSASLVTLKESDSKAIWGLAFAPGSAELWTGSEAGAIRRWNARTGAWLENVCDINEDLQTIALSADGKWLAVGIFGDSSIKIWDRIKTRWVAKLFSHRRFVSSLVFSKDSRRLISGGVDGRVVLWRVPEFEEVAAFEVDQADNPTGDEGVSILRLSPNETALAALTEDGRVRLWRTQGTLVSRP